MVLLAASFSLSRCTKPATTTPATVTCSNPGTSVNIGGSAGGVYYATVSGADNIMLDNTVLNLSVTSPPFNTVETIMDAGVQTCPDFSYSGTPSASAVAYKKSHGYVGKFADGHIVKFVTTSYSGGVALIAYIYQ